MRTGNNNEKGAAAVEFALVLPSLLMILFFIIEFSMILYDKAVITNASREGARAGIVYSSPSVTGGAITGVVNTYCANNLISFEPQSPSTTVNPSAGCGSSGALLTVDVSYTYKFLVLPNFMSTMTPRLTLTGHTAMRCE